MATPTLKSNAGDQKVCKKKNQSWLSGADRKIHPSGSLFGITQQSLVMPNSDPRTDFSIHISHPRKILILFPSLSSLSLPYHISYSLANRHPLYTYAGIPLNPKPVTLNTDPASGVASFSVSDIPCLAQVTKSSSRFLPPQQQEVVLLAGIRTVCSSLPANTLSLHRQQ